MITAGLTRRWPSPRTWAVTLAVLVLATLIGTVVAPTGLPHSLWALLGGIGIILMLMATAVVGLLVAWHQPANPIGWLLLASALLYPVGLNATAYAQLYGSAGSWGRDAAPLAFLLSPLGIAPVALFPLVILLFPDGRLPSRRWRALVWAALGAAVAAVVLQDVETAGAAVRGHFRITADGTLPVQRWMPSGVTGTVQGMVAVTLAVVWLAAIGRQVASWRRSSGDRRQQLKWLASGGVVFGAAVVVTFTTNSALWELAAMAFAAIPLSIGMAILRYRLYDIDRLISRTLGYALVTGLLVGVYAALVLLATQVLRFSSTWAVAASTLAAAALFAPVRRRVQRVVDRRFNRARYDADQTVAAFADRLRDAVNLAAVQDDLAATAQAALQPAGLSVWVRETAWGARARS